MHYSVSVIIVLASHPVKAANCLTIDVGETDSLPQIRMLAYNRRHGENEHTYGKRDCEA